MHRALLTVPRTCGHPPSIRSSFLLPPGHPTPPAPLPAVLIARRPAHAVSFPCSPWPRLIPAPGPFALRLHRLFHSRGLVLLRVSPSLLPALPSALSALYFAFIELATSSKDGVRRGSEVGPPPFLVSIAPSVSLMQRLPLSTPPRSSAYTD